MREANDDLSVSAQTRVGSVLCDKYRLDCQLGAGGMATVYAAAHLRNANRVAVKILHRELSVDAGLRARFLREGYAANSVGHPGTVRVLDDDTAEDGSVFIVMDLLDGETLDARWERSGRRLGFREVTRLAADLLDVLSAAHAKGIVHRDLKPENLFLTRDGQLKVLDFGVARLREGSPTQTRTGAVLGTPAFMPPEQALGRTAQVDALSDVWAVGATAFTLLSGRFVHEGQTAEEMLVHSATQPAPPVMSIAPEVPRAIAAVIDRALAFDKPGRWQSAAAMREALLSAMKGLEAADPHDSLGPDSDDDKTQLAPLSLPPHGGEAPWVQQGVAATAAMPTLAATSTTASVTQGRGDAPGRPRRLAVVALAGAALATVVAAGFALTRNSSPTSGSSTVSAATVKPTAVLPTTRASTTDTPPAPASVPLNAFSVPLATAASAPTAVNVEALPKSPVVGAAPPVPTVAAEAPTSRTPPVSPPAPRPVPAPKRDPLAP